MTIHRCQIHGASNKNVACSACCVELVVDAGIDMLARLRAIASPGCAEQSLLEVTSGLAHAIHWLELADARHAGPAKGVRS